MTGPSAAAGFQRGRQQRAEVVVGGHCRQAFEDVGEAGLRVVTVVTPDFPSLTRHNRQDGVRVMGYSLTAPAPGKPVLSPETRIRGLSVIPERLRRVPGPQPQQPRRNIGPTPTKSASGIPCWPSRDPIGEKGGGNLYAFLNNDAVRKWDEFGLDSNFVPGGAGYGWAGAGSSDFSGRSPLEPDINPLSDAVSAVVQDDFTTSQLSLKLFTHYRSKTGASLTLSKSDLKEADINPMTIAMTKQFREAENEIGVHAVVNWQYESYALAPNTLNQLTVHFDGVLIVCPIGWASFEGKMWISDYWDFDPKPYFDPNNPRNWWGETKTRLVYYLASGAPFQVESEHIEYRELLPPYNPVNGMW